MIINTTFVVEHGLEEAWMQWLRMAYIAEATAFGRLSTPTLARIVTNSQPDSHSYALQMRADTTETLQRWTDELQPDLLRRMAGRWGQRVLHFTTIMEEIAL